MIKNIIITVFSLLLLTETALALEVVFKEQAALDRDTVTLGDIAVLSDNSELAEALASQVVGRAPEPGQTATFDARSIILKLTTDNRNLLQVRWKGSAVVIAERNTITVGSEKILTLIAAFLKDNAGRLPEAQIRFIPESLPLPFLLPTGQLSWDIIPSSPDIIGSSRFAIIAKVDGKVQKNFSVHGRIEAIATILTAAKTLSFGDVVTENAVVMAPRDLSSLQNYTSVAELVIGSRVKRTIRSGAAIDTTALEQPPVVERGELVKMVLNHRGMHVTAHGIARSEGRVNETIRVRNSSSNKLIYCRVQAPGIVEVLL